MTVSDNIAFAGAFNLSIGDITIDENVYWSIWDNENSILTGSLDVLTGGGFYISTDSSMDRMTIQLPGVNQSVDNSGTISFSTLNSSTVAKFSVTGASINNSGHLFMLANGSSGTPVMYVTSTTWINTGFMTFYQDVKSLQGVISIGEDRGTIVNNGDICIYNGVYPQLSAINGTGCIHIQRDSTVLLYAPLLPVSSGQTFFMEDSGSQIVGSTVTALQTYTVAGFGGGNVIGTNVPILSFDYDSTSGILTLHTGVMDLIPQRYNIGLGYDPNGFSRISVPFPSVSNPKNNGITYSSATPNNTMPYNCRVCVPIPEAPSATSTMVSSSFGLSFTATPSGSLVSSNAVVTSTSKASSSISESIATGASDSVALKSETAPSSLVESSSSAKSSSTQVSSNAAAFYGNMGGSFNYLLSVYFLLAS